MENKNINEVRVRDTIIETYHLEDSCYLPYFLFMEALFGTQHTEVIKAVDGSISEYLKVIDNKHYLNIFGLKEILPLSNKEDRYRILSQIFRIKKVNETYEDRLIEAVKTLQALEKETNETHGLVNEYDWKRIDLLHDIEKTDDEAELLLKVKELKRVSMERREAKNKYRMLNTAKSNFDKLKFDLKKFQKISNDMGSTRKQLEEEKDGKLYNRRSTLNDFVDELKEKFNG